MRKQLITIDPDIQSGTPVFAGTRVPVKALFDHLEAGDSLELFLTDFPMRQRMPDSALWCSSCLAALRAWYSAAKRG